MAEPSQYAQFLSWVEVQRLGDLASMAGLLVSVVGFALTIWGVMRSKGAAERAEQAAAETRQTIRLLDTVVDFTTAIGALEEIKRLHRTANWPLLPERYTTIRRLLVTLRTTNPHMTSNQRNVVQSALANLIVIENLVEKGLVNPGSLNAAKFNSSISNDIDNLLAVLTELKMAKAGG